MTKLSIDDVASQLPALIIKLAPGEQIIIVDGDNAVARVTSMAQDLVPLKRTVGAAAGVQTTVAEDDDHLNDFAKYMT